MIGGADPEAAGAEEPENPTLDSSEHSDDDGKRGSKEDEKETEKEQNVAGAVKDNKMEDEKREPRSKGDPDTFLEDDAGAAVVSVDVPATKEPSPDAKGSMSGFEIVERAERRTSIVSAERRRSQFKPTDPNLENTTTCDWTKNLFWALIRLFIFFCTSVILTTICGNYTNIDQGCYHKESGKMGYVTHSGGFEFDPLSNNCSGNQDINLIYYHIGNIFYVLVCLVVLIDCIAPGPWHRQSMGLFLRQISLKFKTWESDHVGINSVRLLCHLLVVSYGNCRIITDGILDSTDYFVYFQDILDKYDYVHFSLFVAAIVVYLVSQLENKYKWGLKIWWNTPTGELVETHPHLNYQRSWKRYHAKYMISKDSTNKCVGVMRTMWTYKSYVWFTSYSLTYIISLFFSVYHLINVNTTDDCKGTEFGKMSFVFVAQVLVMVTVYGYLLHSRYYLNVCGGTDGRSWVLMAFLLMMGYCAIEPKYSVNYDELNKDAVEYMRLIIGWCGLITIALGVVFTLFQKLFFPFEDLREWPAYVWGTLRQLFFRGNFMIFAVVLVLAVIGQFPLLSQGLVFTFECKDSQTSCQDLVKAIDFDNNEMFSVLILMPTVTTMVMILYAFWDRTIKLGNERVVPFFKFGFWFPGFLAFIILNASSYRALDHAEEYFNDVVAASWSDNSPKDVQASNGHDAAIYAHFLVTTGLALLFMLYSFSFMFQMKDIQEIRAKQAYQPNQLFAAWILPLGFSIVALLWGCVTVYYDVHFMVGSTRLDVPHGVRDLFIVGPIFSALIILYAALVSACRAHILTPISRGTVGIVGMVTLFSSVCYVLMWLLITDEMANHTGVSPAVRVTLEDSVQLFSVYSLTFVALLMVLVDHTAEAIPLYHFHHLEAEELGVEKAHHEEEEHHDEEHHDEEHQDGVQA